MGSPDVIRALILTRSLEAQAAVLNQAANFSKAVAAWDTASAVPNAAQRAGELGAWGGALPFRERLEPVDAFCKELDELADR